MRFRLSKPWFVASVLGALLPVSAVMLWAKSASLDSAWVGLLVGVPLAGVVAWLMAGSQTLEISDDGIVINRVYRAQWSDIVGAKRRRILRLEYLVLRMRTGKTWWLPLYLRGETDTRSALLSFAPEGHPIRDLQQGQ